MLARHLEQIRQIFPELPECLPCRVTPTFYALKQHICFTHYSGSYTLMNWDNNYDYVRTRSFKVFLNKIKAVRKEMEVGLFQNKISINIFCTAINEKGFRAKIVDKPFNHIYSYVQIYPPKIDIMGGAIFEAFVGSDYVEVDYGSKNIFMKNGSLKENLSEIINVIVKTAVLHDLM